jgi:hypothetical protein
MQADTLLRILDEADEIFCRVYGVQDFQVDERIDRDEFAKQYAQWLEDSEFDSLPDQMKAHESYKAIVAMGERILPVIAAELRKRPSFLFLALEEITGEDPVPDDAEGNLHATIDAWTAWLRR